MKTQAQILFEAAQEKFGEVVGFNTRQSGDFIFLIRRSECPFPSRPYMTIRGSTVAGSNAPCFYMGHYDMHRDQAHENLQNRNSA